MKTTLYLLRVKSKTGGTILIDYVTQDLDKRVPVESFDVEAINLFKYDSSIFSFLQYQPEEVVTAIENYHPEYKVQFKEVTLNDLWK